MAKIVAHPASSGAAVFAVLLSKTPETGSYSGNFAG
jgi:hypothetical protein